VLSGATPHGLAFVVLSNTKVLIDVTLVDLQNDLRILVHFLMGLGDNKSVFTLASKYQELNSLLLGALKLTEISDHKSALR